MLSICGASHDLVLSSLVLSGEQTRNKSLITIDSCQIDVDERERARNDVNSHSHRAKSWNSHDKSYALRLNSPVKIISKKKKKKETLKVSLSFSLFPKERSIGRIVRQRRNWKKYEQRCGELTRNKKKNIGDRPNLKKKIFSTLFPLPPSFIIPLSVLKATANAQSTSSRHRRSSFIP